MNVDKYEVIPSKRYKRDDGRTASIYGACPWQSEEEKERWSIESVGWTVRNTEDGTTGIGRKPWTSRADARAWATLRNHLGNTGTRCACECHQLDEVRIGGLDDPSDRDAAPYVAFIEGAECCYTRDEMAAFVEHADAGVRS